MKTAIWWLRRDLRLDDNPALQAALHTAEEIIPLFILDPKLWGSEYAGEVRKAFLLDNLRSLETALSNRGSRLILVEGNPQDEIPRLIAETGAEAIFAQADTSPYARKRDGAIQEGNPLTLTEGLSIHPLQSIRKQDGDPYTVFTPYSRAWRALPTPGSIQLYEQPERIHTPETVESLPIPDAPYQDLAAFPAGEMAANVRLERFASSKDAPLASYHEDRNRPDLDGTSKLSPYLRFGIISPRRVAARAVMAKEISETEQGRQSSETYLNELIWREFYIDILFHYPEVRERSFKPDLRHIAWANNQSEFDAWCRGETGYPIVDAAMIQLLNTGWMHNRTRMIVASFLVKDLLIDWRWGEKWFMQHLIDGDPAANNGGWQWVAGTGTDAAPYFRIFNPVLQGKKFDPGGNYVRDWIPALEDVPGEIIHEPWKMSAEQKQNIGCKIGEHYPRPIVDHSWARKRVLAAYQEARSQDVDCKDHVEQEGK